MDEKGHVQKYMDVFLCPIISLQQISCQFLVFIENVSYHNNVFYISEDRLQDTVRLSDLIPEQNTKKGSYDGNSLSKGKG